MTSEIPHSGENLPYKYITHIDIFNTNNNLSQQNFMNPSIAIESIQPHLDIDVHVASGVNPITLRKACDEIIQCALHHVAEVEQSLETSIHETDRGVNSYYCVLDGLQPVHEISFKGENVSESAIRRAVDEMIYDMQENDLL